MTNGFDGTLQAMAEAMEQAPTIVQPSKYWQELNRQHLARLKAGGVDNFKRTLAKDYFIWMRVPPWDAQIKFLAANLPPSKFLRAVIGMGWPLKHRRIPLAQGFSLNLLSRLVWMYAEQVAPCRVACLMEPPCGNPPRVRLGGRLISQDIANSVLEYKGFAAVASGTVCELGGGYGRTAYVLARLKPNIRCVMVDIPPALAVAQHYLGTVFPDRRHFRFREFASFAAVEDEFSCAAFAFLLPHQLAALPGGSVDLFLNISSLHEMRLEQIRHYCGEIHRLVKPGGHFYLKAWKESRIPLEGVTVREEDYPLEGWEPVFRRSARIQERFFETLLRRV